MAGMGLCLTEDSEVLQSRSSSGRLLEAAERGAPWPEGICLELFCGNRSEALSHFSQLALQMYFQGLRNSKRM